MASRPPCINMPFGKYKGTCIHQIPTRYLEWLSDNVDDLADDLELAVEDELSYRADGGKANVPSPGGQTRKPDAPKPATTSGEYAAGRAAGYAAGKQDGYAEGKAAGHAAGKMAGYAEGRTAGFTAGYSAGLAAGGSVPSGKVPRDVNKATAVAIIKAGKRLLAQSYHPDRGGDHDKQVSVNVTAEYLEKNIGCVIKV